MTGTRALVLCDGASAPADLARQQWTDQKAISWRGPPANLNLRAQSLAATVLTMVHDRAADLVRLASYIYAADQELSRGGSADVYGRRWRRQITMCLGVSDHEFWSRPAVRRRLSEVLSFLTEDTWEFEFEAAAPEDRQLTLIEGEVDLLGNPNSVILFSGGADSLCGMVEAIAARGEKPVIVTHRSTTYWDARQPRLVEDVRRRFPGWGLPHLGFWIHRKGSEAVDNTQRSRAFLYASLGAAVADELGIRKVIVADNGVVSLNLPINAQLVGALASRATHPKFLDLFNRFAADVLAVPPQVSNPLWSRTRAEVLGVLKDAGFERLLQDTVSCSRTRGRPADKSHCGYCFQCVSRRFASIAAGFEMYDRARGYGLDIFTEGLPAGEARTTAESFVRFARRVAELREEELLDEFPQLDECLLADDPQIHLTAERLASMLERDADSNLGVLQRMYSRLSPGLARGDIPADSLLGFTFGGQRKEPTEVPADANVFRKEGQLWTITYRGTTVHLNDARGLDYLARLLSTPHREVHASVLAGAPPVADERRFDAGELRVSSGATAQALADARTVATYEAELRRLETSLLEAEGLGEPARIAEIREELEDTRKLIGSIRGRGGRARKFGDASERARKSASAAIHRSQDVIASSHPALGAHLRVAVEIGNYCCYRPDSGTAWQT